MPNPRLRFNLLNDHDVKAAFEAIRDPMPEAFAKLEPRHRRAIANAIEAAILRKLNNGTVPSLYTKPDEPGSLYRPVAESISPSGVYDLITYRNMQTGRLQTDQASSLPIDKFRPILHPGTFPGGMNATEDAPE